MRVTKTAARGKTRVAIEPLDDAERPREIARMLAGAAPSAEAAAHADEMLRAARDAVTSRVTTSPDHVAA